MDFVRDYFFEGVYLSDLYGDLFFGKVYAWKLYGDLFFKGFVAEICTGIL